MNKICDFCANNQNGICITGESAKYDYLLCVRSAYVEDLFEPKQKDMKSEILPKQQTTQLFKDEYAGYEYADYVRLNDTGIIVIMIGEHGSEFVTQCGGHACLKRKAVGEILQVATKDIEDKFTHFFLNGVWGGWCDRGIDEETALFIEGLIPNFLVDRSRMCESIEAWIFGYYNNKEAVLTWQNSD